MNAQTAPPEHLQATPATVGSIIGFPEGSIGAVGLTHPSLPEIRATSVVLLTDDRVAVVVPNETVALLQTERNPEYSSMMTLARMLDRKLTAPVGLQPHPWSSVACSLGFDEHHKQEQPRHYARALREHPEDLPLLIWDPTSGNYAQAMMRPRPDAVPDWGPPADRYGALVELPEGITGRARALVHAILEELRAEFLAMLGLQP